MCIIQIALWNYKYDCNCQMMEKKKRKKIIKNLWSATDECMSKDIVMMHCLCWLEINVYISVTPPQSLLSVNILAVLWIDMKWLSCDQCHWVMWSKRSQVLKVDDTPGQNQNIFNLNIFETKLRYLHTGFVTVKFEKMPSPFNCYICLLFTGCKTQDLTLNWWTYLSLQFLDLYTQYTVLSIISFSQLWNFSKVGQMDSFWANLALHIFFMAQSLLLSQTTFLCWGMLEIFQSFLLGRGFIREEKKKKNKKKPAKTSSCTRLKSTQVTITTCSKIILLTTETFQKQGSQIGLHFCTKSLVISLPIICSNLKIFGLLNYQMCTP